MTSKKNSTIEAVFFDIGNVLVSFDGGLVLRDLAWAARRHPLKIARLFWNGKLIDRIERGEMLPRQLYKHLRDEMEFEGGFERFEKIWCGHFRLMRPTFRLLERVAKRRPTYLLSNTNRLHYAALKRRYAFPRRVKDAALSYKLGCRKPEPAIYRAAVKMAGVKPRHSLFIDDLSKNVSAAKQLGWNALRFTTAEALEADFKRFGVL
jgi:FMN phosphatase YigB (HAD superfamily)